MSLVLVAGAGIGGLTAALDLAEAGHDVVVVDPADRIGGKLQTSTFAGRDVDEAADAFLIRTPAALDLARRVGLAGSLVHPARRDASVWIDGAPTPLPSHVLGVPLDPDEVERLGVLSPAGLRALRDDLELSPTDGSGASPTRRDPAANQLAGATSCAGYNSSPNTDISLGDAVAARIGEEAYSLFVEPLVGGISAGDPARLSLTAVAPQLDNAWRDAEHPSLIAACRAQVERARAAGISAAMPIFAAPSGGMAALPQAVAEAALVTGRADIRLGVGLDRLERGTGIGRWAATLSDGSVIEIDAAVLAGPGHASAQSLASVDPEVSARLGAVDHVSVAFVRLALGLGQMSKPPEGSGVLFPRSAATTVTACSWSSRKWEHLAPEAGDGTTIVRAAVGRDGDAAALALDDAALVERVVDDLRPVLGLIGEPAEWSVHRWHNAFPQYRPGHLQRVSDTEAALAEVGAGRLALSGMHLRGVGIPAVITSARAAAAQIIAAL